MTAPKRSAPVAYTVFDRPIESARILLVDDDPIMRNLVTRYLQQEGYTVATAQSGPEALEKFDEFSPDVLCLDYQMPGMSGHEVARQIRERKDMLYVPIIMLTASGEHLKLDSLESGVDAFLTKPAGRTELTVTIRTLLRMKMAQDTMLAALERVAEVQDELLAYERLRGQAEAMQTMMMYVHELSGPVLAAQWAAQNLEAAITLDSSQQKRLDELNSALEKVASVIEQLNTHHT